MSSTFLKHQTRIATPRPLLLSSIHSGPKRRVPICYFLTSPEFMRRRPLNNETFPQFCRRREVFHYEREWHARCVAPRACRQNSLTDFFAGRFCRSRDCFMPVSVTNCRRRKVLCAPAWFYALLKVEFVVTPNFFTCALTIRRTALGVCATNLVDLNSYNCGVVYYFCDYKFHDDRYHLFSNIDVDIIYAAVFKPFCTTTDCVTYLPPEAISALVQVYPTVTTTLSSQSIVLESSFATSRMAPRFTQAIATYPAAECRAYTPHLRTSN